MYKFTAAGEADNNIAFALGELARDLTDEEYKRIEAAGLLSKEAKALFRHESAAERRDKDDAPAKPAPGKDGN